MCVCYKFVHLHLIIDIILDSPKRQRMRDEEQAVKPDTPAIPSVRSRLQNLSAQNAHWSDTGKGGDYFQSIHIVNDKDFLKRCSRILCVTKKLDQYRNSDNDKECVM